MNIPNINGASSISTIFQHGFIANLLFSTVSWGFIARHHEPHHSFLQTPPSLSPTQTQIHTKRSGLRLYSSSPESDNVDMMRQLLESSWNVESMGVVPSTPESAAEAAGRNDSNKCIFMLS